MARKASTLVCALSAKERAAARRGIPCLVGAARAHIYRITYLLRTSETRYYWITFLIRPLFPARETGRKSEISEESSNRKLLSLARCALRAASSSSSWPVCLCTSGLFLFLSLASPLLSSRFSAELPVLQAREKRARARREAAGAAVAPRRILYFRIPDGITMREISFVIYARERAATNEHIFA